LLVSGSPAATAASVRDVDAGEAGWDGMGCKGESGGCGSWLDSVFIVVLDDVGGCSPCVERVGGGVLPMAYT
jgi:hypothetical protein